MKVTLFALNSSYSHTSLAIRAIGAALQKSGETVTLVEKNLKDAHAGVLRSLWAENADVYGFSVYIWNVREIFRFAAELRVLRPNALFVLGGPEVSFEDARFFDAHPFADVILAGEGEDAFPALCRALAAGTRPHGVYHAELFRGFEESGIYYDEIGETPHGLVYYESTRGCPFSCAYCLSSVRAGVRAKSAKKALDDLLRFEAFDDIRTVKLVDRTFNFDRERAKTIWRGLMRPCYTKEYHFEVSAALLDEESIALLSTAPKGKFRLEIGVQSTNEKTISAVARALDTQKTLRALAALAAPGNLHLHTDLIAGLPHEDYRSFGASFDAVYGLGDVMQLGFLKLLRGSALRRDAEQYGIRYSPEPPYQVLSTAALPYEALARLERIEDVLERYANSGKFSFAFPALPRAFGSPFAFFEALTDFIGAKTGGREMARVAQTEAFSLLLSFVSEKMPAHFHEARERLALDFLLGETRKLPPFLKTGALSDAESEEYLRALPRPHRAEWEILHLDFLSERPTLIDRAEKTVRILE